MAACPLPFAEAAGCDAIVHLAGIPGDREDIPDQVMAVNVSGTWNVLPAAQAEHGIETPCLRPAYVVEPPQWADLASSRELGPARGTSWHLGVFVDVRDVADAFSLAVSFAAPADGHARLLL